MAASRVQGSGFDSTELAEVRVQGSSLATNSSFNIQHSAFFVRPSSFILHPSRCGVTLIEMLIVISIIVILMVVTLSVLQPREDRRVREAAREVNVYLSSARNRALEIGRPCGVIFHRAAGTNFPSAATVLDQCEVPPPYAGDVTDAVVRIQDWSMRPDAWPYWDNNTSNPPPILRTLVLKVQVRVSDLSPRLIRYGDLMQLGGQGPYFTIVADDGSRRTVPPDSSMPPTGFPPDFPPDPVPNWSEYINFSQGVDNSSPPDNWVDNYVLTLALNANMLQLTPWPKFADTLNPNLWSAPLSFKILRQPIKSSSQPLQLPAGSVVDLDFSGPDYSPTFTGYEDVTILFSGNGAVEGYYYNHQPYACVQPIFLLIGKRERVRDFSDPAQALPANPPIDELPNWADLSSIWVAINHQTGMVSTSENYAIDFKNQQDSGGNLINWTDSSSPSSNWPFFLNLSRTYAREQQSMGGR